MGQVVTNVYFGLLIPFCSQVPTGRLQIGTGCRVSLGGPIQQKPAVKLECITKTFGCCRSLGATRATVLLLLSPRTLLVWVTMNLKGFTIYRWFFNWLEMFVGTRIALHESKDQVDLMAIRVHYRHTKADLVQRQSMAFKSCCRNSSIPQSLKVVVFGSVWCCIILGSCIVKKAVIAESLILLVWSCGEEMWVPRGIWRD